MCPDDFLLVVSALIFGTWPLTSIASASVSRGFEFVAINSRLKKHPQFVCIDKNSQYFFIIVRAVMLPENPNNYDIVWMETFKQHAAENKAKVLYAGVALGNPNGEELPIYLNEEYLIEYNGIQVIETNLN